MGYWGVRSYENDDAHDGLDAGFASVHAEVYEHLMDDSNPMTFEEVQARLASLETLDAALEWLRRESEDSPANGAPPSRGWRMPAS